jgi:hypothetical protein
MGAGKANENAEHCAKSGIVDIDIQGSPCAVQEVFGLESREEGGEQELGKDEDYDLQSIQLLKIVMLIIGTQGSHLLELGGSCRSLKSSLHLLQHVSSLV